MSVSDQLKPKKVSQKALRSVCTLVKRNLAKHDCSLPHIQNCSLKLVHDFEFVTQSQTNSSWFAHVKDSVNFVDTG